MSDQAVIVKGNGTIFLGGPPFVKAATGEVVTAEELGGGDVHTRKRGVADYLADDDGHALAIVREIVEGLNSRKSIQADLAPPRSPTSVRSEGHLRHPSKRSHAPFEVREDHRAVG